MKKFFAFARFLIFINMAYADNILADHGDAVGYGDAWNAHPEWQRLGTNWTAESSAQPVDNSDDGVKWSINGGAYGNEAVKQGDSVTFQFTMYKALWGNHTADYLKVWIDWDNNKTFDPENVVLANTWNFTTESSYRYGNVAANISKNFYYTTTITANPGDYWLRARVVCNADVSNIKDYNPYGMQGYGQGETEDYKLTVAPVPEPSSVMLLGLGLIGLVGARRLKK
jgi:hypothetical protein